jgi:hypothetical protein
MLLELCEKIDSILDEAKELTENEKAGIKQIIGSIVIQKVLANDDSRIENIPPIEDMKLRRKALWAIAVAQADITPKVSKKTAKYLKQLAAAKNVVLPISPELMTWAEVKQWIHKIRQMPKPENHQELSQEKINEIEKRLFS